MARLAATAKASHGPMRIVLRREVAPRTIAIVLRATFSSVAKNWTSWSLALPPSGAEVSAMTRPRGSSRMIRRRDAPGRATISIVTARSPTVIQGCALGEAVVR
jgi:hypothetical protein